MSFSSLEDFICKLLKSSDTESDSNRLDFLLSKNKPMMNMTEWLKEPFNPLHSVLNHFKEQLEESRKKVKLSEKQKGIFEDLQKLHFDFVKETFHQITSPEVLIEQARLWENDRQWQLVLVSQLERSIQGMEAEEEEQEEKKEKEMMREEKVTEETEESEPEEV